MIPQIEPWIDEEEVKEITKVVRSTWITEHDETAQFEEGIRKYAGAKHALAVSNGTIALYVALKALGIGEGDEVIVPDMTFIATANSVKMAGAEPVLADIDKKTFNISPQSIENAITKKTKAIMPVHLYAQAADMDEILKIARKHNLKVIEDAAQGIGVYFKGKHAGTFGDIGILSFYGNKTLTTAEGGMILTNSTELHEKCWRLKNHGRKEKGIFVHEEIGYNFCFTDLQAAIGIAQLKKLPKILERKKHLNDKYQQLLAGVKEIKFPHIDERGKPAHWFTSILIDDVEGLVEHLKKNEIQTRRFFYPLHLQPCYKGMASGEFPNAEWAYEHGLSLPSSVMLKDEQLELVAEKIKEFYKR